MKRKKRRISVWEMQVIHFERISEVLSSSAEYWMSVGQETGGRIGGARGSPDSSNIYTPFSAALSLFTQGRISISASAFPCPGGRISHIGSLRRKHGNKGI